MSKPHDVKDRKFLLNQLKSGLGFVNQSIHICRVMDHPTMADRLSAAARTIYGAIVVAEDESAWSILQCHGYTSETETARADAGTAGRPEATAETLPQVTVGVLIPEG